jgi:hypothetical protein
VCGVTGSAETVGVTTAASATFAVKPPRGRRSRRCAPQPAGRAAGVWTTLALMSFSRSPPPMEKTNTMSPARNRPHSSRRASEDISRCIGWSSCRHLRDLSRGTVPVAGKHGQRRYRKYCSQSGQACRTPAVTGNTILKARWILHASIARIERRR